MIEINVFILKKWIAKIREIDGRQKTMDERLFDFRELMPRMHGFYFELV
jgi:hypothetical protein